MGIDDFSRLVVDANIMVGASIGRNFPLFLRLFEAGVVVMAPVQQWAETRHILLVKMDLPKDWVDEQMRQLETVVMPIHPALLEPHRERAIQRLGPRGEPDWPVLAATYATGAAAWSRDNDLFGTGVAVWSTRVLAREMNLLLPAANEEASDA